MEDDTEGTHRIRKRTIIVDDEEEEGESEAGGVQKPDIASETVKESQCMNEGKDRSSG